MIEVINSIQVVLVSRQMLLFVLSWFVLVLIKFALRFLNDGKVRGVLAMLLSSILFRASYFLSLSNQIYSCLYILHQITSSLENLEQVQRTPC